MNIKVSLNTEEFIGSFWPGSCTIIVEISKAFRNLCSNFYCTNLAVSSCHWVYYYSTDWLTLKTCVCSNLILVLNVKIPDSTLFTSECYNWWFSNVIFTFFLISQFTKVYNFLYWQPPKHIEYVSKYESGYTYFVLNYLVEVRINSNQRLNLTVIGHLIHGSLCNQQI